MLVSKRVLGLLVMLLICFGFVSAENHYVTQNGAGLKDGSSVGNAWSVANFNDASKWDSVINSDNGKIGPGDSVFFSGVISSEITPKGSGLKNYPIILDGYEKDDTTFQRLSEEKGRALLDLNGVRSFPFLLNEIHYMNIQDFEITNSGSGGGISVNYQSSDIVIKRNFIHDNIQSGISLGEGSYNVIIGGSSLDGNVIKNIGEDTGDEDIAMGGDVHDVIVSYNHLYGENQKGIDGVMIVGAHNILIEYNTMHGHNHPTSRGEDGVDIKKSNSYNIIVRYNHIYDHDYQTGITAQSGSHDIYMYGNLIYDNSWANILATDVGTDKIYIFSNILYDSEEKGITFTARDGNVKTAYIFNNLISRSALCANLEFDFCRIPTSTPSGSSTNLHIGGGESVSIWNNIFYKARPSASIDKYRQVHILAPYEKITELDYNYYYWPGQTSFIYWGDSGSKTLSQLQTGTGNGLPQEQNGQEGNPGLVDIENNDFRISSSSSPVVDSGKNLGLGTIAVVKIYDNDYPVYWGDALHPNSDWSVMPPNVIPAKQNEHGSGWEKGPYVYVGEGEVCNPVWSCVVSGEWSSCVGGFEERSLVCSDSNSCGTSVGKPSEVEKRACSVGLGKRYTAYKTDFNVLLDGDLVEFVNADSIVLTNSRGSFGNYKFMWDSGYLYVGGEVGDDDVTSLYSVRDGNLWEDDSLEIIFDSLRDGGTSPKSDDYKFFVNSLGTVSDSKRYDMSWNSGIEAVVLRTGLGYVVEARVPFSGWVGVLNNSVWGFNVALNDRGYSSAVWSGSGINNVSGAGEIVFVEGEGLKVCVSFEDVALVIENWKGGGKSVNEILEVVGLWKRGC